MTTTEQVIPIIPETNDAKPDITKNTFEAASYCAEMCEDYEKDAFEEKQELTKLKERLQLIETLIKNDIANEVDEVTGKPKFSNDAKRDAEFINRTQNNEDINNIKMTINRYQDLISMKEIRAKYYSNMVQINCAFARKTADRTNV